MTSPILVTKLFIPATRPELVPRPRLIERLDAGLHRKLSLISAPAGFGKTTLVTEWLNSLQGDTHAEGQTKNRIAWLSLDEGDNDPARFLTYLIAALNHIEGLDDTFGKGVLAMLQSPQPAPPENLLTPLINEIAAIPDRIFLVLDDYHIIESSAVDEVLSYLLDYLPPQLHLIIATREDPNLPLFRLRARGQLNELRATDLRFTLAEADGFLTEVMGLKLSAQDIAALEIRTEGWITGLQMAALSMQGRKDNANFIQAFTGSHHFVLDYLVEEVLKCQPERVRSFLLQTSILERLSGPLCDALTGEGDSRQTLEALERGNLFVIPLDDERKWYRYHHLFADVLQAHLKEEHPNQVAVLHRRASEWYEQNGLWSDAILQALAAKDFDRTASLAERAWQDMDNSFQTTAWLGWVEKLPDELIRARPVLCTQYASMLMSSGDLEGSEARLRDAERWLDTARALDGRAEGTENDMVVVDREQLRTLPAKIAFVRANIAQGQGDVSGTAKYAELALKHTPEEDHFGRAQAAVLLGFTHWVSGDLDAAHKAMANWINSMQKAGNILFVIASTFALADIMIAQGRLREAERAYKQSLQLASEQDEHVQRITAHLHLGLAMLYHEKGNQEAFTRHLLKSRELGEQSELVDWPYRWCIARARIKETQGDLETALDLLDEAKRLYVRNLVPDIRPVEALKARVWIRQSRLNDALDWAHERGLSVNDELSYLREFEHIMLARVLISEFKDDPVNGSIYEAVGLLDRLLQTAEEAGRMGSVIEILVLQSIAYDAQGNTPQALEQLNRALTLAEPEGYICIFVEEGPPMATLLREAASHGSTPNYVRQILGTFGKVEDKTPVTQVMIDPLSERELEVLRLLETEMNGPEIARELMVSLNTLRTHTKNIYSKLGVNKRQAAVRRAKELELL